MQKFIKFIFKTSKCVKMADFALLKSSKLISRKIWVTEKSMKFLHCELATLSKSLSSSLFVLSPTDSLLHRKRITVTIVNGFDEKMRSNLIKAIDDPTNFHKWGEKHGAYLNFWWKCIFSTKLLNPSRCKLAKFL